MPANLSAADSSSELPRDALCAVTGAGGFIGSHLVEMLLAEGYRVRALVHYNSLGRRGNLDEVERAGRESGAAWFREGRLEIRAGDVQDSRCMRGLVRGANAAFHLAALIGIPYSYTAPQSYLNVNIGGTLNLLEACREEGVARVLHTSTSEALGSAQYTPQDEAHPLQAQSPYSATKIAADKLAESYYRAFGLPVTILRPFNTYGPRQSARAVIPTIIAQALDPACRVIRLGALDPVRDLTYVTDTARAYMCVARAPVQTVAGHLYHLGTGNAVSVGEQARLILKLAGVEKPIEQDPARVRPEASEVRVLHSDNARIQREVGWRPEVDLETGLLRTIEWVRANPALFRASEYTQ